MRIDASAARVAAIGSNLTHLDPDRVLERGYSIAKTAAGAVVRDASQLSKGDALKLTFARGAADATVKKTEP